MHECPGRSSNNGTNFMWQCLCMRRKIQGHKQETTWIHQAGKVRPCSEPCLYFPLPPHRLYAESYGKHRGILYDHSSVKKSWSRRDTAQRHRDLTDSGLLAAWSVIFQLTNSNLSFFIFLAQRILPKYLLTSER